MRKVAECPHAPLCPRESRSQRSLFQKLQRNLDGTAYVAAGTEDVNKHMCCSALCACGCLYPPFREVSLRASLDPAHHSSNKLRGLLRWPFTCHCQVFHAQKLEEDEVCGSFRHCLHCAFVFVGASPLSLFFQGAQGSSSFVISCNEFPRA